MALLVSGGYSCGAILCIAGCLAASSASTPQIPVAVLRLWQSKLSPDIVKCPSEDKIISGWEQWSSTASFLYTCIDLQHKLDELSWSMSHILNLSAPPWGHLTYSSIPYSCHWKLGCKVRVSVRLIFLIKILQSWCHTLYFILYQIIRLSLCDCVIISDAKIIQSVQRASLISINLLLSVFTHWWGVPVSAFISLKVGDFLILPLFYIY